MAQPVAKYNGDFITCYPGSNQLDSGKLNLESNMARIVTRLSSKNFCIVKPSFEIEKITNIETGAPQIRVLKGQASINGMDIVAEDSIIIDPPEKPGTYHLAFKLARDSSWNVLGDFVYGALTTFEGLYLTYFDNKPDPIDPDMLYLGQVTWDGSAFGEIIEDEDKYGRIWAEDILCKIVDPKHPDVSRLTLQEWLYKVPDWYFSKEGDVIYGAAEFLPGRDGLQKPGVKIEAEDDNTGKIIVKAPSVSEDGDPVMTLKGTDEEVSIQMSKASIYENKTDHILHIDNPYNINLHSNQVLGLYGDQGVEIGSGTNKNQPKLTLKDHIASFTDSISPNLKYDILFESSDIIQNRFGKAIWQYNSSNQKVSLLGTDVSYLDIIPNADFSSNLRVRNALYIGNKTYGQETTYLTEQLWRIADSNNSKYIAIQPEHINIVNPSLSSTNNSYINLRNTADTIHTKIFDNGKIELLNTTDNPAIRFQDGNTTYNAAIWKVRGEKKLSIDGALGIDGNLYASGTVTGNNGLITQNGSVTFVRGSNNASITKDNNAAALRTSSTLYVGSSGTSNLYAGNTTIKGTATIGSSGQCVVAADGSINTSGTITGSKVYNAVYNDYAEIMKKPFEEVIEPGDLVYVREDGLICKAICEEHFNSIIGICSDTAGVILGGDGIPKDEQVIVGFVGQIWAKTEEEEIKPGQMLMINDHGTLSITNNKAEKFAIALTNVNNGRVRVLFNG